MSKKIIDKKIVLPPLEYHLSSSDLLDFLIALGYDQKEGEKRIGEVDSQEKVEKILTAAEKYADYSRVSYSKKSYKKKDMHTKIFKTTFLEKTVLAPMKLKSGRYVYRRLKIAPSTIKEAGYGVFAVDTIPKGARDFYVGVIADSDNVNAYYSWEVRNYDKRRGEPTDGRIVYYIDCEDATVGNWTRYVNCGPTFKSNNLVMEQYYDKILYIAKREILSGEELFIDYGSEYRRKNLGMRGRY